MAASSAFKSTKNVRKVLHLAALLGLETIIPLPERCFLSTVLVQSLSSLALVFFDLHGTYLLCSLTGPPLIRIRNPIGATGARPGRISLCTSAPPPGLSPEEAQSFTCFRFCCFLVSDTDNGTDADGVFLLLLV